MHSVFVYVCKYMEETGSKYRFACMYACAMCQEEQLRFVYRKATLGGIRASKSTVQGR